MSDNEKEDPIIPSEELISSVVKTVPVRAGNIFAVLNKIVQSKGATEEEGTNILEAISAPDFNILEVTIDGNVAMLSLHEDLIELIRENGFKEDI